MEDTSDSNITLLLLLFYVKILKYNNKQRTNANEKQLHSINV